MITIPEPPLPPTLLSEPEVDGPLPPPPPPLFVVALFPAVLTVVEAALSPAPPPPVAEPSGPVATLFPARERLLYGQSRTYCRLPSPYTG